MRSPLYSLRTRALLLVGFGFCIFLAAMAYQATRERALRLEFARSDLLSTAKLITAEEHKAVESTAEVLASLITSRQLRRILHGEGCHDALAQTVEHLPRIANVLLARPDGAVVCSAIPSATPLNIADRPYFRTAAMSRNTVISEVFEGRVTGKWVLPIYRSMHDEAGNLEGVIAVGLELDWLNRELANASYPVGARLGLIDAQGRVLARHPDPEHWVGRNASETSFFKTVKALGGTGVAEDVGFDGVRRIYGLARFAQTEAGPITLWIGYAADSVTGEADRNFVKTIFGALALLSLTFAAVWGGSERLLLRPISILSGTARRLGTGDLTARTGIGSARDEVGALAQSFDDMAASLERKNRQIILAERALKVLSAWNRVLLTPGDERALAEGMCRAIVDAGGYRLAWVGYAEHDEHRTVRPVASAGIPEDFLDHLQVSWAESEYGMGPAGRAIREGDVVVVNQYQTSPDTAAWREYARRRGYISVIGLPLRVEGKVIGALAIEAVEPEAFAEQEAALLAEVATDLSSAIFAQRSSVERERLRVSLRTSEERFHAAAEASLDSLFLLKSLRDAAGNIVDFELLDMNLRAERQLEMSRTLAIGKTFFELIPHGAIAAFREQYAQVVKSKTPWEGEFPYDAQGKERKWFREQVVAVGDGIAISLRDITAWKNAGDRLRESEARLRLAMEAARMGAWQWDLANDRLSLSEGMGLLFGVASGAGPQNSGELLKAVHPGDRGIVASALTRDRTPGAPRQLEFRVVWPDGSIHWLASHSNVIGDTTGLADQVVGVAMDVTQRKQAGIALERALRALRTLSAGNAELVHATSEPELLRAVCGVIVEKGGYRMALVSYPKDDQEKTVIPVAAAGAEMNRITAIRNTWSDTVDGQRPIAKAIRTGMPAVSRNVPDDPAFDPVRELVAGYASNLALPLFDGTRVIGALSIHAGEKEAFDDAEIELLQELAGDLAYGITTLRTRAERDRIAYEHRNHEQILRKSLEDSIQAIAATVEMRDPYTSGHQRRVADLAVAIAGTMGLEEETIHGIHLAGVVHDLGKITVPAEILAKPGRLSEIEYQLIQAHPQAGYEILKDINFPWPIARIVREHHERMDGSGYPRGIKGGDILLESRIVAVADVVEAMASHRPYRPSLGIETALSEIERGRGTAYDANVVDACVRLFRDGGHTLQG